MARSARTLSLVVASAMFAGLALTGRGSVAVLAQTCDGAWTIVSSPSPGGEVDDGFSGLAVVSANDIWAVGNSGTYGGQRSTLAEHWNG